MLMERMKEHSCGIQPAFGFGDGLDAPNLAFIMEPIFNMEPAPYIPPFMVADIQPALYLGPGLGVIPGNPPQQQAATENAANNGVPSTQVGAVAQYPHISIAEMIANTIAAHPVPPSQTGAAVNVSNNGDQPQLSVAQLVANAIQQQLALPPLYHAVNATVVHDESAPITPVASIYNAVQQVLAAAELQTNANGPSSNQPAAAQFSQQGASELSAYEQFSTTYDEDTASESFSDFEDGSVMYSSVIYNVSSVPLDEDSSNFSNPAFHAPVSSPVHHYSYTASDEEGYTASNIFIIDCAENSENVNENQISDADVPNESS